MCAAREGRHGTKVSLLQRREVCRRPHAPRISSRDLITLSPLFRPAKGGSRARPSTRSHQVRARWLPWGQGSSRIRGHRGPPQIPGVRHPCYSVQALKLRLLGLGPPPTVKTASGALCRDTAQRRCTPAIYDFFPEPISSPKLLFTSLSLAPRGRASGGGRRAPLASVAAARLGGPGGAGGGPR